MDLPLIDPRRDTAPPSADKESCPCANTVPRELYQDDDDGADGLRALCSPIHADGETNAIREAACVFNQAVFHHVKSQLFEAKHSYQILTSTVQSLLRSGIRQPTTTLLELGTRVHCNLGLAVYLTEGNADLARTHFQASLLFSKQLFDCGEPYQLERATILSNWCRMNWIRGDIHDDTYYSGLQEILRIRAALLSWDHPDVAAAHYNLAAAAYTRLDSHRAIFHFMQYLRVAAHQKEATEKNKNGKTTTLDPLPALIYLLLLQNEDSDDSMSQELVRGLRTLQDKRHGTSSQADTGEGQSCDDDNSSNASDVASVLNFIGTLLFHKHDLENALIFFQEELRIEEQMLPAGKEDISVAVTSNNIGRILQECNKLEDAIVFYERALRTQYGDCCSHYKISSHVDHPDTEKSSAASNLYSTVWYNLGLIHDKRGCYAKAVVAFKMSLELRCRMLGKNHPDIACLYYNIGVLQMEQQQLHAASDSLREALRVRSHGNNVSSSSSSSTPNNKGANQLNDERVIKTLEKLASMHKNEGAIMPAIDALREVFRILQISCEYDTMARMKDMGLVLRSISELYHTLGDLKSARLAALHSVRQLEFVTASNQHDILLPSHDKLAQTEQLVSSLLLVGSLHHELCEPLEADAIFRQAAGVLESAISSSHLHASCLPSSLHALREVAAMLAAPHCAPEA